MFDVMDTLVRDPFRTTMPAFFGLSFAELLAAKHPTAWIDFELGRLSHEEFCASFFTDGRPVDADGLLAAMREAYEWLPGQEALLARAVAAGFSCHAASNYPCWHATVEERLGLSRHLRWTAVSCYPHIAARKPSPAFFAAAAAAAGAGSSSELLLIDDVLANCEGARSAGWQAIHFSSSEQLEAELAELGVLL